MVVSRHYHAWDAQSFDALKDSAAGTSRSAKGGLSSHRAGGFFVASIFAWMGVVSFCGLFMFVPKSPLSCSFGSFGTLELWGSELASGNQRESAAEFIENLSSDALRCWDRLDQLDHLYTLVHYHVFQLFSTLLNIFRDIFRDWMIFSVYEYGIGIWKWYGSDSKSAHCVRCLGRGEVPSG
jgi:hypothetical protein